MGRAAATGTRAAKDGDETLDHELLNGAAPVPVALEPGAPHARRLFLTSSSTGTPSPASSSSSARCSPPPPRYAPTGGPPSSRTVCTPRRPRRLPRRRPVRPLLSALSIRGNVRAHVLFLLTYPGGGRSASSAPNSLSSAADLLAPISVGGAKPRKGPLGPIRLFSGPPSPAAHNARYGPPRAEAPAPAPPAPPETPPPQASEEPQQRPPRSAWALAVVLLGPGTPGPAWAGAQREHSAPSGRRAGLL
eukprot:tig00020704_g13206.t1